MTYCKATFNDLMGFQKSQIVSAITARVVNGQSFTWSGSCGLKKVSPKTIGLGGAWKHKTLPVSELKQSIENAMSAFDSAPDGFVLTDFLPSEKDLAA